MSDLDETKALAARLREAPMVVASASRRGVSPDQEAWQVATALWDIKEASTKLFGEIVPKLQRSTAGGSEIGDLLHDVGEEYRHILYHILDSKIFEYIVPEAEENTRR